jgi:hypothetical protein
MWTPQKPSDGSKDDYGLGWGIDEHARVVTVGHGGGQQGTSTFFTIASAQDEGIVVRVLTWKTPTRPPSPPTC